MSTEQLLKEYDNNLHIFEGCKQTTERLIHAALDKHGLRVHKLECRVKHRESLKRKIDTKSGKYESLSDITDIVALRIITFFEDEVDKVAEVIKEEFDIDMDNSIDKRLKDSEKFGYQSLHYVFTYKKGRTELIEYEQFKELKCEIQIRSILQHAWAEIEHDIGYKSEVGVPLPAKRNFMRVAALLETADLEFIRLRETLSIYKSNVTEKINTTPNEVLIDQISLSAYIKNNPIVISMDEEIALYFGFALQNDIQNEIITKLISELEFVNITTIDILNKTLSSEKDNVIKFAELFLKGTGRGDTYGDIELGISIFYLIYYLISKKNDFDFLLEYLNKMSLGPNNIDSRKKLANDIINTYKKIST